MDSNAQLKSLQTVLLQQQLIMIPDTEDGFRLNFRLKFRVIEAWLAELRLSALKLAPRQEEVHAAGCKFRSFDPISSSAWPQRRPPGLLATGGRAMACHHDDSDQAGPQRRRQTL